MKIAVTGSTGHIGSCLIRHLLGKGHGVTALYRDEKKLSSLEGLPVNLVHGNILDLEHLKKGFEGADAVIHLAAIISITGDPDGSLMATNVKGSANVAKACLETGISRLINYSSIHAFKVTSETEVVDETLPSSVNSPFAYDRSKALGEREVLKYKDQLHVTVIHPTAVIGPFDYWDSLSGQMIKQLFTGKLPATIRGGYDWVDVRDLAGATEAALSLDKTGERYIVSGNWAGIPEIARLIHQSGGSKPPLSLPMWMAFAGLPFISAYCRITGKPPLYTRGSLVTIRNSRDNVSYEKAKSDLGHEPRPLEETIRDTVNWYRENKFLIKNRAVGL